MSAQNPSLVQTIIDSARPIREPKDLAPLIEQLAQAKVVMLGEASHGTQEFYEWRRIISAWLIQKYGFNFIAVEGDWPPCWEVTRFLLKQNPDNSRDVLRHFNRWPTWMWANTEVERLIDWMRTHNETQRAEHRAGFFGLDVYSLFESIQSVLASLEDINPFLARRARLRYACFDRFNRDERAYARSLIEFPEGCESEVLENLQEMLALRLDGGPERAALFDAQQNARVIANAERYYRAMIHAAEDSWNVRDRHMLETLDHLLERQGPSSKAIVWAHNTHIGDYRATDMVHQGQVNLGGLARKRWGDERVALVGFGTHQGQVMASHAWDGPMEVMNVPAGRSGSYEHAFHEASRKLGNVICLTNLNSAREGSLSQTQGHRAIGVVYNPLHERFGNYVPTSLAHRYDAFMFVDRTSALEPLQQYFDRKEIPGTWPRGQ